MNSCLNKYDENPSISAPSAYEPASTKIDISSLPSAPRAQREGSFDPSRVPRSPPFTAYVGNLPFDTEDDDVINMLARNTVRIVNISSEISVTVHNGAFWTALGLKADSIKYGSHLLNARYAARAVATDFQ